MPLTPRVEDAKSQPTHGWGRGGARNCQGSFSKALADQEGSVCHSLPSEAYLQAQLWKGLQKMWLRKVRGWGKPIRILGLLLNLLSEVPTSFTSASSVHTAAEELVGKLTAVGAK